MNRQQAHERIDAGDLTWGELKTMLRCEMGAHTRGSVVNARMTHEQAVTILSAAIDQRDDAGIVAGPRSLTPKSDRLTATNILRECGDRAVLPKRYCEMCDRWTSRRECRACGMATRKAEKATV